MAFKCCSEHQKPNVTTPEEVVTNGRMLRKFLTEEIEYTTQTDWIDYVVETSGLHLPGNGQNLTLRNTKAGTSLSKHLISLLAGFHA